MQSVRIWPAVLAAALIWALILAGSLQAQFFPRPRDPIAPTDPQPSVLAPLSRDVAALHVPNKDPVANWPQNMEDGGNYHWDIYDSLAIGAGTNSLAYSTGLGPRINGQLLMGNGRGFTSKGKDGDEVETGLYQIGNVNYFRRTKVYKKQALARWIDIFENPGDQEMSVNLTVASNTRWQIGEVKTDGGGNTFGRDDWGLITDLQGACTNAPILMHILCDKKAKVRPQVVVAGNSICVSYSFRLPPRGVAAICYFESQGKTADHVQFMKNFKSAGYFTDLPASARKLILNFTCTGGVAGLDLDRSQTADSIILQGGDPMFGKIRNRSFALQTFWGDITLDAGRVVGMAARPGGQTAFKLVDGQIVSGKSPGAKLNLTLSDGGPSATSSGPSGDLVIPLNQVRQWSYQIDKSRPADVAPAGPLVVLRTGDQLLLDAASLKLDFTTRHGKLQLLGSDLAEINMDNASNGVHRAIFANGSTLGGLLEGDKLALPIQLAGKSPKIELPRNLIFRFVFGDPPDPDPSNPRFVLVNGDELYARFAAASLKIDTEFGPTDIKPGDIQRVDFSPIQLDRVQVTLFDGTVLRGQFDDKELGLQLTPSTSLRISTAQIVSVEQTHALPGGDAFKRAQRVSPASAPKATSIANGPSRNFPVSANSVLPLPKKHLADPDPELRRQLLRVIEKSGATLRSHRPAACLREKGTVPHARAGTHRI